RPPTLEAAGALRSATPEAAFASLDVAQKAIETLDARADFDVMHIAAPEAPPWIAARRRAVRLTDAPGGLADAGVLSDWAVHTDLFVAYDAEEARRCEGEGHPVATAPYLRRAARKSLIRRRADRPLIAGLWIEATPASAAAASALFEAIRARGGGAPPRFALAGPGAADVTPPRLPYPALRLPSSTTERAFYRGVDLALFPDAPGSSSRAPRYEIAAALELGATPIVSADALTGFGEIWRLPRFSSLAEMAEYLFERGANLRQGGLAAELRARADWTWSGLQGAAATQRDALRAAIRSRLRDAG
ncbi:MAG: hypothetical protein AAF360_07425, partial [Pseudomonadota bacterium]